MKKVGSLLAAAMLTAVLTGCQFNRNAKIEKAVIRTPSDLVGKVIACQSGTTGYAIASDIDGVTIRQYTTSAEAMRALLSGNVQAVVIDREIAKHMVDDAKATNPNVHILEQPLAEEEYAIAYKKGDTEFGDKLNQALDTLRNNGTLDEINGHWIGDNADKQPYVSKSAKEGRPKLRMGTNAAFPPYESFGDERIVGIDPDIMTAVCDELGMELVIVNMQFESILPGIVGGSIDVGAAAITVSDKRKELVDFSQSYASTEQVVIVDG